MKSNDLETRPLTDAQVDADLRDLLTPAGKPTPHAGFSQRLTRAIADSAERERRARRWRPILAAYWVAAAIASMMIVWHLGARLTAGPGLWLSLGGVATLASAALVFTALAALPLRQPEVGE